MNAMIIVKSAAISGRQPNVALEKGSARAHSQRQAQMYKGSAFFLQARLLVKSIFQASVVSM